MDPLGNRCKGCGIVFDYVDTNIDKCAKKRLYCELCLAQKNPLSKTEKKINKRYIQITSLTAFLALLVLFTLNWGKNKNDTILEYFVVFCLGYLLIWVCTSILLLPVLARMKKPHKEKINKEKEQYREEIAEQKAARNSC